MRAKKGHEIPLRTVEGNGIQLRAFEDYGWPWITRGPCNNIEGHRTPWRSLKHHRGLCNAIEGNGTTFRAIYDQGTLLRAMEGHEIPLRAVEDHRMPWRALESHGGL